MKKTSIVVVAITSLFLMTNCSNNSDELNELDVETLQAKTSGGSCTSTVDFDNLVVETSWPSGSTGNRNTYDACGVDGESWMDKYNDGRVMMKCLSGKGHRTELKEDSGQEASLSKYRKIKFEAKFTSIPKNGVTIAQIHNRGGVNRPWIRVFIDNDRYIRIKETETNPAGSSSSYSEYTGPKYTSGQSITLNLWTGLSGQKKGKVNISTGGKNYSKTLSPSSAWNSYSNDYYLKAGVYSEGSDKTATVKYDSFYIIH